LVNALQLDEAERTHLVDLIHAAGTTRVPRRPATQQVRPTVQRVLDAMIGTPALALNERLDILAANQLGFALFSPVYADPVRPPNNARFVFLDLHAAEFFRHWDKVADDTVALLHAEAWPPSPRQRLSDLIGELSTRSEESVAGGQLTTCRSTPPASSSPRGLARRTAPEQDLAYVPRRQDRGQFPDGLRLPVERHADAASQSPGSGDGLSPGCRQAWARRESSHGRRDVLRDPREIP
jgi:hypothetical protein